MALTHQLSEQAVLNYLNYQDTVVLYRYEVIGQYRISAKSECGTTPTGDMTHLLN